MTKSEFLTRVYQIDPLASKWLSDHWYERCSDCSPDTIKDRFMRSNNFSVAGIIHSLFNWERPPQGGDYWYKIYETARKS